MLLYFLSKQLHPSKDSHEFYGTHWLLQPREVKAKANDAASNSPFSSDPTDNSEPEIQFSCISYSWGSGCVPSQFHPDHLISDRTVPTLSALIHHRPSCTHIWIDAFCVPRYEPARTRTLQNMGWIYARAVEVVVVLSAPIRPVLEQMARNVNRGRVELAHLDLLERDDWISRAWTYQEAVNAQDIWVTCVLPCDEIIEGDVFLNRLGFTLSSCLEGSSSRDRRKRYPRLDAFEDVIHEWMVAGYQERSALQVMASMDRRVHGRAEDHFYAMMGAVSDTELVDGSPGLSPFQAFISLCEGKGDYSFIFSAAEREKGARIRWRPVEGHLPAILPWISWGERQPGRMQEGVLCLEQIMVCQEGPIKTDGRDFVRMWLANSRGGVDDENLDLAYLVFVSIQNLGWKGSSERMTTGNGHFFPFKRIPSHQEVTLFISTTIRWPFGAPGLACFHDGGLASYMPGVFVGQVDNSTAQSVELP